MRSIQRPQKVLLSAVFLILLLTTTILIYFLLRNNAPSYSAKLWFEAISNADAIPALELTCTIRKIEVMRMIEDNLNDNIQEVDISNIEFASNIVKIRQLAIVEAKGIFTAKIDNEIKDVDIQFFWRFNYENGKWKWCGEETSERSNTTLVIASIFAFFS